MLVRLVSDMHLEFGKDWETVVPELPEDGDTILVVAGDIDTGTDACEFLQQVSSRFAHVLYVLGNHEFYNNDIDTLAGYIREELEDFDKITLLDNESLVLGDIRFIGSTLWTDIGGGNPTAMVLIEQGMADYSQIRRGGRRIFAPDTIALHKEAVDFIVDTLNEEHDGPTIVVTHHLPSFKSVHPMFHRQPMASINAGFYSNLEGIINAYDIAYWFHGHTHCSMDYEIEGTKVRANPCGYGEPGEENENFDPNWRIEL